MSDTPRTDAMIAILHGSDSQPFLDFTREIERELTAERAAREQCEATWRILWRILSEDVKVEQKRADRAEARLADACFHLQCAARLMEQAALEEDGADGDECLEQKRNIDTFLSSTAPPPILAELKLLRAEVGAHRKRQFDESWALQCEENWRLENEFADLKLKLEAAKAALNVSAGGLTAAIEDFALLHNAGVNPARESTWLLLQDSRKHTNEALAQLNGATVCPRCGATSEQEASDGKCDGTGSDHDGPQCASWLGEFDVKESP